MEELILDSLLMVKRETVFLLKIIVVIIHAPECVSSVGLSHPSALKTSPSGNFLLYISIRLTLLE